MDNIMVLNESLPALEPVVLQPVPDTFLPRISDGSQQFTATIIDLKTTGLDSTKDKIIEIGMLSFSFSKTQGIIEEIGFYNELNDPGQPVSSTVTEVTGIRDDDFKGRVIDWAHVQEMLEMSDLMICHNSGFNRTFLERQTPSDIQDIIHDRQFACTDMDINWKARGFDHSKLADLTTKTGFFNNTHRAINDCRAILNLLVEVGGAFNELLDSLEQEQTLLCAPGANRAESVYSKEGQANHFFPKTSARKRALAEGNLEDLDTMVTQKGI